MIDIRLSRSDHGLVRLTLGRLTSNLALVVVDVVKVSVDCFHTSTMSGTHSLAHSGVRPAMRVGDTDGMDKTLVDTHNPFAYLKDGTVAVWRAIADSDGWKGGHKQYVVRIQVWANGNFLVTKHWGKTSATFEKMQSMTIGTYDNYYSAKRMARLAMREKISKGYWMTSEYDMELQTA